MTNSFYQPDGTPAQSSFGSSAAIRAEFALVASGFDKIAFATVTALLAGFPNGANVIDQTIVSTNVGQFRYVAADVATADNGGTIRVDAAGRRWYYLTPSLMLSQLWGIVGDGATDNSTAMANLAAWLNTNGGTVILPPAGVILYSGGITLSGTGFKIIGNGCTLKVKNSTAVDSSHFGLQFSGASNFNVESLLTDGNRANRTLGAAVAAHNIMLIGCAYFSFRDCRNINSCCDGWYISATSESTPSTFTHDGQLANCSANNSYRNGLSIIVGAGIMVLGGTYDGSNGAAPQDGIDIEADAGAATPSNYRICIIGASGTGNQGNAISIGVNGTPEAVYIDKFTADGTGVTSSTGCGASISANSVYIGTLTILNYTQSTNFASCAFANNLLVNIDRLVMKNCSPGGTSAYSPVYGLGITGRIGLVWMDTVVPYNGTVLFADTSSDLTIEHVHMNACGRNDQSGAACMIVGAKSKVLSGHFQSCKGFMIEANGSAPTNNSFTNLTFDSCDVGAPALQCYLLPLAGDIIDNIRVTNPTIHSGNTYLIRGQSNVIGKIGTIIAPTDPAETTGFHPQRMLNVVNPPELTVTSGTTLTINPGTRKLIWFNNSNGAITFPSLLSFPGNTDVEIEVINQGSGTMTQSAASGDSIPYNNTVAAFSRRIYTGDVVNRNWVGN